MNAAFAKHVFAPPQGDTDQRALARQPATVVEPFAAIHFSGNQYAVEPAFENRGHGGPEEREGEHQQVAGQQFFQLGADVVGQRAGVNGVALFQRIDAVVGIGAAGKILGAGYGVEAHRVEVGNRHRVPLLAEDFYGGVFHCGAKRLRFRVSVDNQNVHRAKPVQSGKGYFCTSPSGAGAGEDSGAGTGRFSASCAAAADLRPAPASSRPIS